MRYSKVVWVFFLLSVGSYFPGNAQGTVNTAKLDSLFSLIEKEQQGMGSLSIWKDGKQLYSKGFGYANMQNQTPTSASTKYRIGSVTKTFTAAIIMQLIEEKKLMLDTPLRLFFPQIPNADKITIEHLLRHRSGLFNYTAAKDFTWDREQPITQDKLIEKFVANGTVFEPDEQSEYSNTNYVLLSFIAEQIDKKAFANILQERITQPLALPHTYYGGAINLAKGEAFGYSLAVSWEQTPQTHMSLMGGAGAIVSNPTDLNRFYHALFIGNVVSENSLQEMTKLVGDFGIGMGQLLFDGKQGFGHIGGMPGFKSAVVYFPEEKVSIACTINGEVMALMDIVMGVLSIYYSKEYSLPSFDGGMKLTSAELEAYTGVYSSPSYPRKITIFKKENLLLAQASGTQAIRLEAYALHKFKANAVMLKIEFVLEENRMILDQGKRHFFTKEK